MVKSTRPTASNHFQGKGRFIKNNTPDASRKRFRKLRVLTLVAAACINLLLLLGTFLYFMDDDDYRHVLIWSADYFLDSQLEIDGAFTVRFDREFELAAEKVRLKANDGSYDLSLGKLNIEQRLGSYLSEGRLWINSLSMEDLHGEMTATETEQDFDWQEFSLPVVVVEEVHLRNLSLVYTELDQQQYTLQLSHVSLDDSSNTGPVKVSAAGLVNAQPLQLDGTLGSMQQLRSMDQPYPIELNLRRGIAEGSAAEKQGRPVFTLAGTVGWTPSDQLEVETTFDVAVDELIPILSQEIIADGLGHLQGSMSAVDVDEHWQIRKLQFTTNDTDAYQLRVDGTVDNSGKFDLRSDLGVPVPAECGARFGIGFNGYAPFKSKGLLSGNRNRLSYQGKTSIGRIESETALTASLKGGKPNIRGKLIIAELYLADIGIDHRLSVPLDVPVKANLESGGQPMPEAPTSTSADSQAVFDREPLDFSGLQQFNLDLEVSIDQITGADFSIDKLAGRVRLTSGALRISPMKVTFEGGVADLELALDTHKTPSVSLKVTTDDLQLGGVVPHAQKEMQVRGQARLYIDINSEGHSAQELASALAGELSLGMEDVHLPKKYLGYLSADELEFSAASDAYTTFEIDGSVAVKFGSEVELTTEAVHMRTNDGSYDLSLGKLVLEQYSASYLETGELWIQNLSVADLQVNITEAEAGKEHGLAEDGLPETDWHEFDLQVSDWPFVIIENINFSNLSLVYTDDDQQDTANLSSLVLDNDNRDEPMTLNAAGMVNERTLKLDGTVGTPAQPRRKNQVYPIEYTLSSGTVDVPPVKPVIGFNGSVDRTRPGGSQIEGRFDMAVSELLVIFNQELNAEKLGHLQGSVNFAEVNGRWGIKKLDLASTDTDLYQLRLDGVVDKADKFELRSQFDVPDPAALGAQFDIDFTGYAPYKSTGLLRGNRSRLNYEGHGSIGRIVSETTLAISLVEGKPTIQGKFVIPALYLPDIGKVRTLAAPEDPPDSGSPDSAKDKEPGEPAPVAGTPVAANPDINEPPEPETAVPVGVDSQIVFDREPLDFSGLQGFNLDLEILIDEIIGVDYAIDQLAGRVKLDDGVLRISPMHLTFEGGIADLELVLSTRNTPSVILKLTADDLLLEKLIADVQKEVPVKGKAHLSIDLNSKGYSPHELASSLSGEISFSLENASVPKIYVELLAADVFGWMTRMATFETAYTTLNCVMTGFDVDQGVAKSKLLFADGPQLSIEGTATLDLGQETIDMELLPKQKKRVHSSVSAVKVTGSLANPDVEASPSKAVAKTIGLAMLVPQVIIPVFLVEQVWKRASSNNDAAGCAEFIAQHEAEQQKVE